MNIDIYNKKKYMISIIVATFNAAKVLRTALDSVLMQTFQDWECIIVDGASKDDTLTIVEEYERLDNRFWHISEPDKGIYDAFNKGWKNARGEWIYYLGSDDKLTPDGLAILYESSNGYDVVVGNVYGVHRGGKIRICKSSGLRACHQAIIVKRTVIKTLGGFDLSYSILADYDLMWKLSKYAFSVKNIDIPVAYFASDGISQSFGSQWKIYKERTAILGKYKSPFPRLTSFKLFVIKSFKLIIFRLLNI